MLQDKIVIAIKDNDVGKFNTYIKDKSFKINEGDSEGYTALHYAAKFGNPKMVDQLLDMGAKADALSNDGYTPLHLAAEHGRMECMEKLLDNVGGPSEQSDYAKIKASEDDGGFTAQMLAKKRGQEEAIEFLQKIESPSAKLR